MPTTLDLGVIKWPDDLLAQVTALCTIDQKYQELGGAGGFLGLPTGPEAAAQNGGKVRTYAGGAIYWHQSIGAHEVHGEVLTKYKKLGAEGGFLGYPKTDVLSTAAGRSYSIFQGGVIITRPATTGEFGSLSPVEVHGSILEKYKELNAYEGILGYPQSDEVTTSDGKGKMNLFENGDIYWTAATGAHEVHGAIRTEYDALGGPSSFLGFPKTDETKTPDGVGRYNHFVGGSIYWSPSTGAHEVHGDILKAWAASGWEKGSLGYPLSDEFDIPGTNGRRSVFVNGALDWYPGKGVTKISHFYDLAAIDWRYKMNASGTAITFYPWVANGGTKPINGPAEVAIGMSVGPVAYGTTAGANQKVAASYALGVGERGVLGAGLTVPFGSNLSYSYLEFAFNISGEPWVGSFCDSCFRDDLNTGKSNNGRRFFWAQLGADSGQPFEGKPGSWIVSQTDKQLSS